MRVFDVPEPRARPRDDVAPPGPPGRRRVARPTPRGRENDGENATSSDDDATDDDSTRESDDADDENCGASERRARYRSVAGAGDGAQCCVVGADGVARGVWRATLFAEDDARDDDASVEDAFRALVARKERPWVVVLARGGHFAASAFDAREIGEEGDARASAAKRRATASRYVVRAKAGGRQVSKDGVKNIKSAGSSMRRANERALEADMREAFASMKTELEVRDDARFRERRDDDPDDEELAPETDGARVVRVAASASLIFVSVSKVDARTIFNDKNPMLDRKDPRVRRVPFMTGRPTFNETRRVIGRLATVNLNVVEEEERLDEDADALAGLADTKFVIAAKPKPPPIEAPPEAEVEIIPEPELHAAARAGDSERVLHLLIEENADPTESYKGKLPYVVSKDKETRDAFRRAMAQKPDAWDWIGRAAVPSALTEELEAKKAAKEAEYEAARKEKEKERKKAQKERKKKQSAAAALLEKTAAPASSGVAEKKSAALVEQVDKVSNDRREQMALAAERRMQAQEAARKASVGALGGARFRDTTTIGGGPTGPTQ